MRKLRTRTVGAKLTPDEYALVEAACHEHTVSEWVRKTLLVAAGGPSLERVLIAEVLAMRAIVVTVLFSVLNGEKLTAETMHRLIEREDQEKLVRAQEHLALASGRMRI